MRVLLLGARGAVGTVVQRELSAAGHTITAASRGERAGARIDLHGSLAEFTALAAAHEVVINASGVERPELVEAAGSSPFVEISATASYLEAVRRKSAGSLLLGAGLVPGLSTILVANLATQPSDDVDVLVMLGSGERHGPSAVAWTAGLVGRDVFSPPENRAVRNFHEAIRVADPAGRRQRYLRADFPDHVLIDPARKVKVRSYLTLGSPVMTRALEMVGRVPLLRGALTAAPHIGTSEWHVMARNRRTDEILHAQGVGQSEATGRLVALAAVQLVEAEATGAVTMADVVSLPDAEAALRARSGRVNVRAD